MAADKKISLKIRFARIMPVAETIRLNSGHEMPVIGFGTWQIHKLSSAERVRDALEAGYRHIDCAAGFKNQAEIAAGVRDWCNVRKIRREELFLSSKIWNTAHSYTKCHEQIEQMLEDFDTSYMDLILIHWPYGWAEDEPGEKGMWPRGSDGKMRHSHVDYLETWRALEDAHRGGKARSIGFCNFNLQQAERVWNEASIKPSVVQIELNPLISQLQYREYCKQRGIVLTAFSPIGNPGSAVFRKHEDPNLLFNDTLQSIARGHGKSVVQVILRWIVDSNLTAIIKSADPKRIRQNINIFKFRLTPEEIAKIDALNIDFRILNPIIGNYDHPYFPWPHQKP